MYHGNHNCSDRCRTFSIMICQKEKVLDPTFHFVGEGDERVEELMIPVQVFVLGQSLTKIFFFCFSMLYIKLYDNFFRPPTHPRRDQMVDPWPLEG